MKAVLILGVMVALLIAANVAFAQEELRPGSVEATAMVSAAMADAATSMTAEIARGQAYLYDLAAEFDRHAFRNQAIIEEVKRVQAEVARIKTRQVYAALLTAHLAGTKPTTATAVVPPVIWADSGRTRPANPEAVSSRVDLSVR